MVQNNVISPQKSPGLLRSGGAKARRISSILPKNLNSNGNNLNDAPGPEEASAADIVDGSVKPRTPFIGIFVEKGPIGTSGISSLNKVFKVDAGLFGLVTKRAHKRLKMPDAELENSKPKESLEYHTNL